jgi:hypothetical protein
MRVLSRLAPHLVNHPSCTVAFRLQVTLGASDYHTPEVKKPAAEPQSTAVKLRNTSKQKMSVYWDDGKVGSKWSD